MNKYIFLLFFCLLSKPAFAQIEKEISDSIDSLDESSKNKKGFINCEILSGIGTYSMGEQKNSGLPLCLGVGIPVGKQWYLFQEFQIVINDFPGEIFQNIRDCEIDFSIGYLEKKGKIDLFFKSGITAFYKSEIAIGYLMLNLGVDIKYPIGRNYEIYTGVALRSSGWSSFSSSGSKIKIGISKNF